MVEDDDEDYDHYDDFDENNDDSVMVRGMLGQAGALCWGRALCPPM